MSEQTETAEPDAPAARRLTRRQRRRLFLGVQYAIFVLVILVILLVADWSSLKTNFTNWDTAKDLFPDVITIGLKNTAIFTVTGYGIGLAVGIVVALMRLSSVPPYRWFAIAYIEVFRGLPAAIIVIFMGVGIPIALEGKTFPGGAYGQLGLALGLVAGAYIAETVRAGIQAVPKGQMEAARSLGMSYGRAMISIVIPQAFRIVIPPLTNELVLLIKDTSLLFFLGGILLSERDLTKFGRDFAGQLGNSTPIIVTGACYLLLTLPLGYLARRLEARQLRGQR